MGGGGFGEPSRARTGGAAGAPGLGGRLCRERLPLSGSFWPLPGPASICPYRKRDGPGGAGRTGRGWPAAAPAGAAAEAGEQVRGICLQTHREMGWLRMAHTRPASSIVWTQRRRQRSAGTQDAQRQAHTRAHTRVHTQVHMHTHAHTRARAHTRTDKGEGARGWPSKNRERGGDGGGSCDLGQGPLVSEPCSGHRRQRRWGTLVNPEPCWSDGLPYRITDWGVHKVKGTPSGPVGSDDKGDHECGVGSSPTYTELNQQLGYVHVKEQVSCGQDLLLTCPADRADVCGVSETIYNNFLGLRTPGLS